MPGDERPYRAGDAAKAGPCPDGFSAVLLNERGLDHGQVAGGDAHFLSKDQLQAEVKLRNDETGEEVVARTDFVAVDLTV